MIDASAFNFDAMKEAVGVDPFAQETNRYASDDRFYKLQKDKEGNGAALIRFIPDSEKGMIQKLFKMNTTITKNGKKRFVSEFSPSSIGQPCPFQEEWQKRWNAGDKEGAKLFGRGIRYVANIKVLKDPANPQNEGKIFLFEMSGAMKDKIQNAVDPSEQDRALGAQPKELFNPLAGNNFRLVSKKGANGIITYETSEVINEVTSIYNSVEEALEDIKNNTYKLSDLLKPESFLSYDELVKKKSWVLFEDQEVVTPAAGGLTAEAAPQVAQVAEVQPAQNAVQATAAVAADVATAVVPEVGAAAQATAPQPAPKSDSLDDLLNGLV
jgi:hypothetical protein